VPYLLRERPDIPVYGSKLTLALVRAKLAQHNIRGVKMHEVHGRDVRQVGEFEIEFLAVTHSIPDAFAVAVRTVAGLVLHTGDFKIDQLPLDGRTTDLRGFARLGEEGVDLFLIDSTNAERPGFTESETVIRPALERVFDHAEGKVVVATFASHIHRVQQVVDEAVRHGRKVAFAGRSMVRNMTIAIELGYLNVPGDTLVALDRVDTLPDDEITLVCTGSQGEPLAALSRIASGEHPAIRVGEGDVVVLASSLIPGNETSVTRVINGLLGTGAEVVHKDNALVHVSGHANSGELLLCYNLVQPRQVMPVHGELRHLMANAELAISTGVPREGALVVQDGFVVDMVQGSSSVVGRLECGYIFVDGSTVGDIGDAELTDRKILGDEGFVSVIAAVDFRTRSVVSDPAITARGFIERNYRFDEMETELSNVLAQALADGVDNTHQLQQLMRRHVGRWVNVRYRRRPMILPVVIET
jgi:ribonuclease J